MHASRVCCRAKNFFLIYIPFLHEGHYMIKKAIDVSIPIHSLLEQRYSGVSYDPSRVVSKEAVLTLAEAGRWAPSCFGDEPWRFIICNKQDNPEASVEGGTYRTF